MGLENVVKTRWRVVLGEGYGAETTKKKTRGRSGSFIQGELGKYGGLFNIASSWLSDVEFM